MHVPPLRQALRLLEDEAPEHLSKIFSATSASYDMGVTTFVPDMAEFCHPPKAVHGVVRAVDHRRIVRRAVVMGIVGHSLNFYIAISAPGAGALAVWLRAQLRLLIVVIVMVLILHRIAIKDMPVLVWPAH
jgi:hypothetical protein